MTAAVGRRMSSTVKMIAGAASFQASRSSRRRASSAAVRALVAAGAEIATSDMGRSLFRRCRLDDISGGLAQAQAIFPEEIGVAGIEMQADREANDDIAGFFGRKLHGEVLRGAGSLEVDEHFRAEKLDPRDRAGNARLVVRLELEMFGTNADADSGAGMGGAILQDGATGKMHHAVIADQGFQNIDARRADELRDLDMAGIVIDRGRRVDLQQLAAH